MQDALVISSNCESRIARKHVAFTSVDMLGAFVLRNIAYKFEDRFDSFYADLLNVLVEVLGFNS